MAIYVDTSALLKRYIDEPDSGTAQEYLLADTSWFSGRPTYVEVRRSLAKLLFNDELVRMRGLFEEDWKRFTVVELDEVTGRLAADIGEQTGLRTLDALHVAAAVRLVQRVQSSIRESSNARTRGRGRLRIPGMRHL